jgi:hypothetical protein
VVSRLVGLCLSEKLKLNCSTVARIRENCVVEYRFPYTGMQIQN